MPIDPISYTEGAEDTAVTAADKINLAITEANSSTTHRASTANPHAVTKAQVGLGNVDDTADIAKTVSVPQQIALNLKADLASPALTGTPTAPTPTTGDSSAKIATTAYADDAAAARAPGTHATQHQHGGTDEIAVSTPAANAIPKAGADGRLDAGFMPAWSDQITYVIPSGTDGDGSAYAPLVADTPAKVKLAFAAVPDGGTIVFGPGTYTTDTIGTEISNKSIRIIGAGRGATTFVRDATTILTANISYCLFSFNWSADTFQGAVHMSDLSIDCQFSAQGDKTDKKLAAIRGFARFSNIERIDVTDCGNYMDNEVDPAVNHEAFYVSMFSQAAATENQVHISEVSISGCDTSGGNAGATHIGIIAQNSGDAYGVIEDCYVEGSSLAIGINKTSGVTVRNNTIVQTGSCVGILHDTADASDWLVEGNTIHLADSGVGVVLGAAFGASLINPVVRNNRIYGTATPFQGIKIDSGVIDAVVENNYFLSSDASVGTAVAVSCNDATSTAFVRNNTFDPARWSVAVGGAQSATVAVVDEGNYSTAGTLTNRQAQLDALTGVASASNEHVLTKDTATGEAVFKAGGAGDMLAANNLSEVDPASARANLGVPATAHTHDLVNITDATPASTGVLTGGVITASVGTTLYSITAGTGIIVSTPGAVTEVTWGAKINVSIAPTVGSGAYTNIGIDLYGDVVAQNADFTPTQRRDTIVLGEIVHTNLTNVESVYNEQITAYNPGSTSHDIADALGVLNVSGNVFSANASANLTVDKSSGVVFKAGSNYSSSASNPHRKTLNALTALTFSYVLTDGTVDTPTTNIDPDQVDTGGGVLDAVPNNYWSVQRIFCRLDNSVRFQRGAESFATKAAAIAGYLTEDYSTEEGLAHDGILRGYLVVRKGATDLSDPSRAYFISAPRFGDGAGGGGASAAPPGDASAVLIPVIKASGGIIGVGQVVRAVGWDGSAITVELADSDTVGGAGMPALGIARGIFNELASGFAVFSGVLDGIDTSSFSVGSPLYVSATPGALTATKPSGTDALIQKVAICLSQDATAGVIQVVGAGRSNDLPNFAGGADKYWYSSGTGAPVEGAITADGRAILSAADHAAQRTLLNVADGANNYAHPNHTGDVTSTADGATVIAAGAVDLAMLSATGTKDSTTFLRGDNTFTVPPSGGGGNVSTDAIWDAAGDLVVGSGADTAAKLPIGTEGQVLKVSSGVVAWGAGGGGASQLSDLSDVVSATNTDRFVVVANGTTGYVGRALEEADISDLQAYITGITGSPLSDLSDVTISTPGAGEVVTWNGSAWINETLAEAGIQPAPTEGAFANGDKTKLDAITGTNTGNEVQADQTTSGIAEVATSAEINTGALDTHMVTPLGLAGSQLQTDVTANNAKVTNVTTNLSYTAAPTTGTVVSSDGNDATLPLATGVNAGLLAPGDFTKLSNTSNTNSGDQTITLTGDVTGSGTGSFASTIAAGAVDLAMLSATGTKDSTTFLRGDNTFAEPPGTGGVGDTVETSIYIDAGALLPDATAEASSKTGTNGNTDVFLLANTEKVYAKWSPPPQWDAESAITIDVYWSTTGATAGHKAKFALAAHAAGDTDPWDAVFPTATETADDSVEDSGEVHVIATGNITVGGTPAAGDLVFIELERIESGATQMSQEAEILGIRVHYQNTLKQNWYSWKLGDESTDATVGEKVQWVTPSRR